MQKLIEIRRRIGVVGSIRGITRTMATVASAKLSKTRERAAGMRVYTETIRGMIRRQQAYADQLGLNLAALSPFLTPRAETHRVMVVHLAGDRGLCGAYNLSINRAGARVVRDFLARGYEVELVAKGTRGASYLERHTDAELSHVESWRREGVSAEDVDELYERVSSAYLDGSVDEVWAVYTRFFSPLTREPTAVRLLPLAPETAQAAYRGRMPGRWFYEPDFAGVLTELLDMLLRLQLEDVLLEAYASEQGARMITMEEATERADRTLQELKVSYNRLRRESITRDLLGALFASRLRGESVSARAAKGAKR